MIGVRLADGIDLDEWRARARELLHRDVRPEDVGWSVGDANGLFDDAAPNSMPPATSGKVGRVPKDFIDLADTVLAHRDPQRHALPLPHAVAAHAWRAAAAEHRHGRRRAACPRLRESRSPRSAQDACFRSVPRSHCCGSGIRLRCLFEPEHFIVERTADFFVRRFAGMRWSILTPYRSVHWDRERIRFAAGAARHDAPQGDVLEDLWRDYFANVFNPARLKVNAMRSEMPVKYWKNLPRSATDSAADTRCTPAGAGDG